MNVLEQYPELRKFLYLAQWVVNLVIGTVGTVLAVLGKSPLWFVVAGAAFNFIWTFTGITAQSNVVTPPLANPEPVTEPVVLEAVLGEDPDEDLAGRWSEIEEANARIVRDSGIDSNPETEPEDTKPG